MAAPRIFTDEQREFIKDQYLRQFAKPSVIALALNGKFKTDFTLRQVNRLINDNWSKRLRALKNSADQRLKNTDGAAARELARRKIATAGVIAERSANMVMKALDFAERAADPRSLQSAAAATKSFSSTWRTNAGLDGPRSGGVTAANFNFNFANASFPRAGEKPADPVVEVVVSEATAEVDDEDDVEADDRS